MLRSRLVIFVLNIVLLSGSLLLLLVRNPSHSKTSDEEVSFGVNDKFVPDNFREQQQHSNKQSSTNAFRSRSKLGEYAVDDDIFTDKELRLSSPEHKPLVRKDYGNDVIATYTVPHIQRVSDVNCGALFNNDEDEMVKARQILATVHKAPIYEEKYLEWLSDCETFKRNRGYVVVPLSVEEQNYPLAFSIAMYRDFEQTERLLRALYQPQNIYCIHVDTKSPLLLHRTVRQLASCFHNVFLPSHQDKVKWGDLSVITPEMNCMRDFVRFYRGQFNYFINLAGQEFPLRTNREFVQIAKIFNGSNDIAGSLSRMEAERVDFYWTHRWSKTYQQTIFYNTNQPRQSLPYNLTYFKGELHGMFSRRMVEYMVENSVAQEYFEWCRNSGHPSEHYWNTLNYNRHLAAPGGYEGPLDKADAYSFTPLFRAKNWMGFYGNRKCEGYFQRGICVYGLGDLPWLAARPELIANKFNLTYQYYTMDCLEERHRTRTMFRHTLNAADESFIRDLPTVKYGRKNGL